MRVEVLMCYFLHAFSQKSLLALSRTISQWSDAIVECILVQRLITIAGKGQISSMFDVSAGRDELDLCMTVGPEVCRGRD